MNVNREDYKRMVKINLYSLKEDFDDLYSALIESFKDPSRSKIHEELFENFLETYKDVNSGILYMNTFNSSEK